MPLALFGSWFDGEQGRSLGPGFACGSPRLLSLAGVRANGVLAFTTLNPQYTELGARTEGQRTYFCSGTAAALTRPDLMARLYPTFAALDVRCPSRDESVYRKWVHKLPSSEYADELVVLAVALELRICICCMPHTPESAVSPWAPAHVW